MKMKCAYCGEEIYQGLRLEIQMEKWPEFYAKVTKWCHEDCEKVKEIIDGNSRIT